MHEMCLHAALAATLELTFHDEGYATLMCSHEFVRRGQFDSSVRKLDNFSCWMAAMTKSCQLCCVPFTLITAALLLLSVCNSSRKRFYTKSDFQSKEKLRMG